MTAPSLEPARRPRKGLTAAGWVPARRRPRLGRAFTLVELMVVIAIISILVGALMPEFAGSYRSMQLSTAAGQVGDMMAFSYSGASAQQTDYRLNLDPPLGRFWITREVELETGEREYQPVPTPGFQTYVLPESVRLDETDLEQTLQIGEEGSYFIQFKRDGTADFSRLRLLGRNQLTAMDISLNGLTGRVTIREVVPEDTGTTNQGASGETAAGL